MWSPAETRIGRVSEIVGSRVTIRLDPDLVSASPIWRGDLVPLGVVGSVLVFPQGSIRLLATVRGARTSEVPEAARTDDFGSGPRWLDADLMGELDDEGNFERGSDLTPAVGDAAHFGTQNLLQAVYNYEQRASLRLGSLSSMPSTAVALDLGKLVSRHFGVFGASGSGKTSFLAHLLQAVHGSDSKHAHVVVIDTQGEYAQALGEVATVLSPHRRGEFDLPAWVFPARDLLATLIGREPTDGEAEGFVELVVGARRSFAQGAEWLDIDARAIGPDTPVPFNLFDIWYEFDRRNHATYKDKSDPSSEEIEDLGNAERLEASVHATHAPGNAAPYRGSYHGLYRDAPRRMRARMLDPRFGFLLPMRQWNPAEPDPLPGLLDRWAAPSSGAVVIDLKDVAAECVQIVLTAVLDFSLELGVRARELDGSDAHPTLIVVEESHRFFEAGTHASEGRRSLERVAREGRKYGVGLALVSQRPADISATVLSQLGTFVSFRLSNAADVASVATALPDSVANLGSSLSSLRTGEAVVSGEAIAVPSRVRMPLPSPQPRSLDSRIEQWAEAPEASATSELVNLVRKYR